MKHLLIVAHTPSPNTKKLADSVFSGSQNPVITGVDIVMKTPFETTIEDVLWANAVLLGTTENLGYIIPTEVVVHFLEDFYRHSRFTGFGDIGFE